VTPDLHERLILLRHGELPEEEASVLQAQIASDPALAAGWQEICAVLDALETLPDPDPPLHLQHRVALRLTRRRWGWPVGIAGLAAAAAALLLVARPDPPQERVLVDGAELVEGRAEVRAGDATIAVDGLVGIAVDPSALTVTVFEGHARVRSPSSALLLLEAGASRTFDTSPPSSPAPPPSVGAEEIEALRAEIAVLRGQLDMLGANEVPFPQDPGFSPQSAAAILEEAYPQAEVELDCDEFPCLATLPATHTQAAETQAVDAAETLREVVEARIRPETEVTFQALVAEGADDQRFLVITWYPEDLEARLSARLTARLEAARQVISGE
jgi:hypothetical protein